MTFKWISSVIKLASVTGSLFWDLELTWIFWKNYEKHYNNIFN